VCSIGAERETCARSFYAVAMEDGPEFAEEAYEFGGTTYRLAELESQMWRVCEGNTYLGIVTGTDPTAAERWPHYMAKCAGEEDTDVPATDYWRAALGHLIDASQR
jgi:hypothetical protein